MGTTWPSETQHQPQELLITLLGNELLHRGDAAVWAGGLVEVLAELGYSVAASRAALARLVKRGLLDRSWKGREAYYHLTERAVVRLSDDEDRLLGFPQGEPGGSWTMLHYSLPSHRRSSRDRLRRQLAFLGYGSLHDGSWIAPGDRVADTDRVVRSLGLTNEVDLFVGRPALSTDVGRLVDRAWPDLAAIGLRYQDFHRRWLGEPEPPISPVATRLLLMHEWRQFPLMDPGLADLYLPWAAHRSAARDLFHHRWHALADGAAAAFALRCRLDSPTRSA